MTERWCHHDEAAIDVDGVCECGFTPLMRRIEGTMRLLVADGYATPAAERTMYLVLKAEAEPR